MERGRTKEGHYLVDLRPFCSFTRVESGGYSLWANEEEIPSVQCNSASSKSPNVSHSAAVVGSLFCVVALGKEGWAVGRLITTGRSEYETMLLPTYNGFLRAWQFSTGMLWHIGML